MAKSSIPKRGVYAIECVDGRAYVGGSVNLPKRWVSHRSLLRKGTHENSELQAAWDLLGPDAFAFTVLEEVPTGDVCAVEQAHIDRLQAATRGFNLYPKAGSPAGYMHSTETRAKVSAANQGKRVGAETRAKISAGLSRFFENPQARAQRAAGTTGERNGQAKLTANDVSTIRLMAAGGLVQRVIADRFGVDQQTISKIVRRARWASVR